MGSITVPEDWHRFDSAVAAINQARAVGLMPAPGAKVLEELEALAVPFRGSARVEIEAVSGKVVLALEVDVSELAAKLYEATADAVGQQLLRLVCDGNVLDQDLPLFSHGILSGHSARVTLVLLTVPCAHHTWNFRSGAGHIIHEDGGPLAARLQGGAHCTEEGVVLDGNGAHVLLDTWEWGGPSSFEVVVKYRTLQANACLFCFRDEPEHASEMVALQDYTRFFVMSRKQLSVLYEDTQANGHITDKWVQLIATTVGKTMALYVNGSLVHTIHRGEEVGVMKWSTACLGKDAMINSAFLDGTIAQFRIWHGRALNADQIAAAYVEAMESS